MKLSDADRIVVTTFDAAGAQTVSSEWVVEVDHDTVGFWTPHAAPWAERFALTDVVTPQAAGRGGKALREEPVLEGRGHLVAENAPEFAAVKSAIHAKYGAGATLAGLVDKAWELGGTASPEGVVVLHIVG